MFARQNTSLGKSGSLERPFAARAAARGGLNAPIDQWPKMVMADGDERRTYRDGLAVPLVATATAPATPAATATDVMMTAVLTPAAPAAAIAAAAAVTVTPVTTAPAATLIDALVPMIWPAAFTTSTT